MSFQVRIGKTSTNASSGSGTAGTDYVELPISSTYKTTSATLVNNSRNAQGDFVGTVVGKPKRKIEMSWRVIGISDYSTLAKFFNANFVFYAYYFDMDDNAWETREFYVSDRVADTLKNEQWTQSTGVGGGIAPKHIENFKISLIDTGKVKSY